MAFKLAVVDQVERGELTYAQAQDRYGIQGASTVLVWLRKHGRQESNPQRTVLEAVALPIELHPYGYEKAARPGRVGGGCAEVR